MAASLSVYGQRQGDGLNYPGFKSTVDMDRVHVQKQGDAGDSVKWIQRRLPGLVVDGVFGPKTADAVKKFQTLKKIAADGIVGLDTAQFLAWVAARATTSGAGAGVHRDGDEGFKAGGSLGADEAVVAP